VAVGSFALKANITGTRNTAVGTSALCTLTTGIDNVGVGLQAGDSVTTGATGTYVGGYSGQAVSTGNGTYIGKNAGYNATTGVNNVAVGLSAGNDIFNITDHSNRIVLSNNSATNAYIKIDWTVTSDKRDKTEIENVPHGLDFVNQLKPVSFKFKKSRENSTAHGLKKYGFLAQDILELEGDNNVIIDNENDETLKVTNSHLIPVLVNAIKELKAQNDSLKSRIETLES